MYMTNAQTPNRMKSNPEKDLSPAVCLTLLGYPSDQIMSFAHCSLKEVGVHS